MDYSIIDYESAAFINPNETKITETIIVNRNKIFSKPLLVRKLSPPPPNIFTLCPRT